MILLGIVYRENMNGWTVLLSGFWTLGGKTANFKYLLVVRRALVMTVNFAPTKYCQPYITLSHSRPPTLLPPPPIFSVLSHLLISLPLILFLYLHGNLCYYWFSCLECNLLSCELNYYLLLQKYVILESHTNTHVHTLTHITTNIYRFVKHHSKNQEDFKVRWCCSCGGGCWWCFLCYQTTEGYKSTPENASHSVLTRPVVTSSQIFLTHSILSYESIGLSFCVCVRAHCILWKYEPAG